MRYEATGELLCKVFKVECNNVLSQQIYNFAKVV